MRESCFLREKPLMCFITTRRQSFLHAWGWAELRAEGPDLPRADGLSPGFHVHFIYVLLLEQRFLKLKGI